MATYVRSTLCQFLLAAGVLAPSASAQILQIDNDIPAGTLGHWSVAMQQGGESRRALITAERFESGTITTQDVIFDYFSYVDVGDPGSAVRLSGSQFFRDAQDPDKVTSSGSFIGQNGNVINWTVTSFIPDGSLTMTSSFRFESADGGSLGPIRLLQYMDEDVEGFNDDVFFWTGTPAGRSLQLFTFDNRQVYGVSHSGSFDELSGLEDSVFAGWAADIYDRIQPRMRGTGQPVSPEGVVSNLSISQHPQLGTVLGPADIVTVMAWDVDPNASAATIVTSLGGLPSFEAAFEPPDIPAPGPRSLETSDLLGFIDPAKPTVVLTHGLQPEGTTAAELWTGFGTDVTAGSLLEDSLGTDVNLLQFIWEEANQIESIFTSRGAYLEARGYVFDAGETLATRLAEELGPGYSQPVHFIGHSLGTAVSAYAARQFLNRMPLISQAQVTVLDAPMQVFSIPEDQLFAPAFFVAVLPIGRQDLELRIDNFFSQTGFGVGDRLSGPIYNHLANADGDDTVGLEDPADLHDEFFDEESGDTDHSGVHQWYRWTIAPFDALPDGNAVCNGAEYAEGQEPDGFDASLNPCEKGWHWAVNRPSAVSWEERFPRTNGFPVVIETLQTLELEGFRSFGCDQVTSGPTDTVECIEASSPFAIADVTLPADAAFIEFNYDFMNGGDGDYAAVFLNDVPVWILSGGNTEEGTVQSTGALPLGAVGGVVRLTIALYGVGEANAGFAVGNFRALGPAPALDVQIDVKPGSSQNPINPRSQGRIPVAILTTEDFNAAEVDAATVAFGVSGVEAPVVHEAMEDVDGDGDYDLVLHFETQDTGLSCDDTEARLAGLTSEPQVIVGVNSIRTVGCNGND